MGREAGDLKAQSDLTESGLTDFDLYLFGEGKHERIYEKLGAHPYAASPRRARVSPCGRPTPSASAWWALFNHWDGRTHVMHGRATRRAFGNWRFPASASGTVYKYEIRDRAGRLFVKADPYGFAMQLRPENCSVVASLDGYAWQDSEWLAQREARRPAAPALQCL